MSNLFKPSYTKVDRKTGQKSRRKSRKWYGQFTDPDGEVHRVPLCNDKTAAQALLNEHVRKAERKMAGLIDPFEEHRKRPLVDHLEDFRRSLDVKENTGKHVQQTHSRLTKLCEGCQFRTLKDLSASKAADWLADKRDEEDMGFKTSNYYLAALKQFADWLVRESRLAASPFVHLTALNSDVDVRRKRRAASAEELKWLIVATRNGDRVFRGLTGADRAMLYLCAAYTGLRSSELASLTAESLDLEGDVPTVAVAASYSKRRRLDTQPLRPDLAVFIRAWLASRSNGNASELLWPGTWSERAAKMLRQDLATARNAWLEEVEDENERQKFDKSDFLRDEDRKGHVLDFHSLRHTFISNLAIAGVHPKVAQQLARHSTINLTMDRYTHVAVASVAGALTNLPMLPSDKKREQAAESNSAGDAEKLALGLALNPDISCQPLSSPGKTEKGETQKTSTPKSATGVNLGVETRPLSAHERSSGGGIRTPDTRIMIPLL